MCAIKKQANREMTSTVVSACFKLIAGYKEGASSNVKDFPLPSDEQKKTHHFSMNIFLLLFSVYIHTTALIHQIYLNFKLFNFVTFWKS